MEEVKDNAVKKQNLQEQGEEKQREQGQNTEKVKAEKYLAALFWYADWIPEAYKKLAVDNQSNIDCLKELYLCACDDVPAEKAAEAMTKKPPEGALRFLRRKQLEDIALEDSKKELAALRKKTGAMEKEVAKMSEMVSNIAAYMQEEDDMFPEPERYQEYQEQLQQKNNKQSIGEEKPVRRSLKKRESGQPHIALPPENAYQSVAAPGRKTDGRNPAGFEAESGIGEEWPDMPITGMMVENRNTEAVPDSGTFSAEQKPKKKMDFLLRRKERSRVRYIECLLKEGYDTEQLDFLLDCIEEGMTKDEIQQFASPKLPVRVMQRLKSIGVEGREEHGK